MAGGTMGGGGGRRGGGGAITGINVTPMVDLMLVLLVIMMVSATYVIAQALKVDLSKSESSDGSTSSPVIVSVQADGTLFFNDAKVTEEQLVAHLKATAAENKDTTVVVSADTKADHGSVVHVMDLARRESLTKFAVQVSSR